MTKPSGPGSFLRKYGCRGCWGLWGRRGHWGQWGCRGLLGLENHYWVFQVLEINSLMTYITYFGVLKRQFFLTESWKPMLNFSTFSVRGCWGQPMFLFQNWLMKLKCPNLKNIQAAANNIARTVNITKMICGSRRYIQGLSTGFDILWRPRRPTKNNFLVKMKVSVHSWGLGIWVSSTSF